LRAGRVRKRQFPSDQAFFHNRAFIIAMASAFLLARSALGLVVGFLVPAGLLRGLGLLGALSFSTAVLLAPMRSFPIQSWCSYSFLLDRPAFVTIDPSGLGEKAKAMLRLA
jgi:hypothetical protein